jgi:Fe-S-cluster-containing dehydrogenase component
VRFFNFWEPDWPEPLNSQLNPDVTVRSKGIMEKCTFCVQRINRVKRDAARDGRTVRDGELQPACAQACPTDALVFGNWNDPASRINALAQSREYRLLSHLGTEPSVVYLKPIDSSPAPVPPTGAASNAGPPPEAPMSAARLHRAESEGQWLGGA